MSINAEFSRENVRGKISLTNVTDKYLHDVNDYSNIKFEIKDKLINCKDLKDLFNIISEYTEETPTIVMGNTYLWVDYDDYTFDYDLKMSTFEMQFAFV